MLARRNREARAQVNLVAEESEAAPLEQRVAALEDGLARIERMLERLVESRDG